MKRIVLSFILCLLALLVNAQQFLYNVDFSSYFDNREYKPPYQMPQTIFAFRLSPELGVGFIDKAGGSHRVMAGVHYTQPIGGNWKNVNFTPTAYYEYLFKGFNVSLGAIPYSHRIETLPDFLMYDSIAYAHPNIQGALLQYHADNGYVEFMCDWRGSQATDVREMFRLILNGRYHYNGYFTYFVGGIGQINHKAGFAPPTAYEGVCDDIYVSPNIGIDFSRPTPFDTLSLRASYIVGIQKYRAVGEQQTPQGFMLECFARWRFLALKNTLYVGENLMPYYPLYGAALNQGDPFFQSNRYNRLDVFAYIVRKSFVNCYFSWNFHMVPNQKVMHQQQLIVTFSLDGLHKEQKLRGLFDK